MKQETRELVKKLMDDKPNSVNTFVEFNMFKKEMISESKCAFCQYPNFKFRDPISIKEYEISALCQDCQDDMFGKEVKDEN